MYARHRLDVLTTPLEFSSRYRFLSIDDKGSNGGIKIQTRRVLMESTGVSKETRKLRAK